MTHDEERSGSGNGSDGGGTTAAPPAKAGAVAVLSVQRAEKTYLGKSQQPVAALRGVTFDVAAGEFVSLMGPSGCGKSTLLHLAGAMDQPTAGSVLLDGEPLGPLSEDELAIRRRDKIGFVFQFFNLLPTLDVRENVALPALLQGLGKAEADARADRLLDRVGLAARRSHFPNELSGGEMQRAAVARALVTEPLLVLADEPTGSLDSATGEAVMQLLAELNAESGVTFIVATHSGDVARFTRRTLRLVDGTVASDGPATAAAGTGSAANPTAAVPTRA